MDRKEKEEYLKELLDFEKEAFEMTGDLRNILLEGQLLPRFVMAVLKHSSLPEHTQEKLTIACISLRNKSEALSKSLFQFDGSDVDQIISDAAIKVSLDSLGCPSGEA